MAALSASQTLITVSNLTLKYHKTPISLVKKLVAELLWIPGQNGISDNEELDLARL